MFYWLAHSIKKLLKCETVSIICSQLQADSLPRKLEQTHFNYAGSHDKKLMGLGFNKKWIIMIEIKHLATFPSFRFFKWKLIVIGNEFLPASDNKISDFLIHGNYWKLKAETDSARMSCGVAKHHKSFDVDDDDETRWNIINSIKSFSNTRRLISIAFGSDFTFSQLISQSTNLFYKRVESVFHTNSIKLIFIWKFTTKTLKTLF